jgi:ribonuclease HII
VAAEPTSRPTLAEELAAAVPEAGVLAAAEPDAVEPDAVEPDADADADAPAAAPRAPRPAKAKPRKKPKRGGRKLFQYDRALGVRFVAGADEAGRGCLAGPLVAAAVLFDYERLGPRDVRAL